MLSRSISGLANDEACSPPRSEFPARHTLSAQSTVVTHLYASYWQPYSVKYFAFWLLFWTFLLSPHVVTLGGKGKTRIFSVLTHFSKLVNLAGVTAHTVPSVDNVSMAVYVYAGRSEVRRKTCSECVLRLKAGFANIWRAGTWHGAVGS